MAFNWMDWVLLAVVAVSALISLKRGFLREALSLVIWFASIILSLMFYKPLAQLLQPYIESPSLQQLAAIIGLFVTCLVIGGLLSFLLSQLVAVSGLGGTDRLLGMVFGALRGVVVVVVVLMIGKKMLPLDQELWWQQSMLLPHFLRLETWTVSAALYLKDLLVPLFAQLA